jgi:hypothetical protein
MIEVLAFWIELEAPGAWPIRVAEGGKWHGIAESRAVVDVA